MQIKGPYLFHVTIFAGGSIEDLLNFEDEFLGERGEPEKKRPKLTTTPENPLIQAGASAIQVVDQDNFRLSSDKYLFK